jgi:hypothetical protein
MVISFLLVLSTSLDGSRARLVPAAAWCGGKKFGDSIKKIVAFLLDKDS